MRTLVLGIPLPNLNFDNFSFLSAPSFTEYQRIIVEVGAAAIAVQQAADGTAPHTTYGGQAIVNGIASAHAFPLVELLAMRKRETDWLLSHGGLVIIIAHPETTVANVAASQATQPRETATGADHAVEEWRSYSWLPQTEGFSFQRDLPPGFGRNGGVLTKADHPFAPYITALAPRVAYRAYVSEEAPGFSESGTVFARSSGGLAIGFDLPVPGGQLVLLPALADPNKDRPVIATSMVACLERWDTSIGVHVAERL